MKKNLVFSAILAMFVLAIAVSAQDKAPNFSGTWTLDVGKSKLDENARIESMTWTVAQTDKDIKVATATKRTPPPAGAPGGQGGGGGMGRGGGLGGGDATSTYTLDGKPVVVQQDMRGTQVPVTYTGKWDGAKLSLSKSSTFTGQNGEIKTSNNESWSLSADGNTLTVNQDRTTPRGSTSSTMIFNKNK